MFKAGIPVFIVDIVLDAVRFYTEKLGFDVVAMNIAPDGVRRISYLELRKGKCFIIFREPSSDEQVESSQVKHCIGRGSGLFIELKKDIDIFYDKCLKKKLPVLGKITDQKWGFRTFTLRDPFGIRLMFGSQLPQTKVKSVDFLGEKVNLSEKLEVLETLLTQRASLFGLKRRAAKKYAKLWLKQVEAAK